MGRPYTPIELDKTRNLRYGMKAFAAVEDRLGKPLGKIDLSAITYNDLAVFLWAGLRHEDPEITPEKVMDLIDEHSTVVRAAEAFTKAITESVGKNA